eukprot:2917444-Prymnesium_polylepis.2
MARANAQAHAHTSMHVHAHVTCCACGWTVRGARAAGGDEQPGAGAAAARQLRRGGPTCTGGGECERGAAGNLPRADGTVARDCRDDRSGGRGAERGGGGVDAAARIVATAGGVVGEQRLGVRRRVRRAAHLRGRRRKW